jgi:hypothetical protein
MTSVDAVVEEKRETSRHTSRGYSKRDLASADFSSSDHKMLFIILQILT